MCYFNFSGNPDQNDKFAQILSMRPIAVGEFLRLFPSFNFLRNPNCTDTSVQIRSKQNPRCRRNFTFLCEPFSGRRYALCRHDYSDGIVCGRAALLHLCQRALRERKLYLRGGLSQPEADNEKSVFSVVSSRTL